MDVRNISLEDRRQRETQSCELCGKHFPSNGIY